MMTTTPTDHARSGPAPAPYITADPLASVADDTVIARAIAILIERADRSHYMHSPKAVQQYLTVRYSGAPRECFGLLYLDSQHGLLGEAVLFHGTLTQTSVYPREVVKAALHANAAAVVLWHNHPSGQCEPSAADKALTTALKAALALVDVAVLDHLIVARGRCFSFAERGLL
jgi:DNA repair protein RadC